MTEMRGTPPVWGAGEPLVTATAQPDWEALAERHTQEARRRKQIRAVAAGVVATAAIGGIVATVVQIAGPGHQSDHTAATAIAGRGASAGPDGTVSDISAGGGTSGSAIAPASPSADAPPSAQPSALTSTPSSAAPARSTAAASAAPVGPPQSSAPVGSTTPGSKNPAPSPASTPNPYSPGQVCGSGYSVIDSHGLAGATVYLLYSNATGNDCVVTLATNLGSAVPMNATLSVQGGSSASNPGSFTDYAGPVVEHAPKICVQWGGSYQGSTWTSGWSHCG